MCVPEADGSDQLMNDGGDATLLMHKGKELEVKNAKDGYLPDPVSTNNASHGSLHEPMLKPIHMLRSVAYRGGPQGGTKHLLHIAKWARDPQGRHSRHRESLGPGERRSHEGDQRDEEAGCLDVVSVVASSGLGQTVTPIGRAGSIHGHTGQHFITDGSINGGKILNKLMESFSEG